MAAILRTECHMLLKKRLPFQKRLYPFIYRFAVLEKKD